MAKSKKAEKEKPLKIKGSFEDVINLSITPSKPKKEAPPKKGKK